MMSEERVQKFHTDDTTLIWEAASYWLKQIWSLSEALPRSVLQHLYRISALIPLTSQGTLLGGVAKCWLSSRWLMCSYSTSSQQMQRAIQQFTSLSM